MHRVRVIGFQVDWLSWTFHSLRFSVKNAVQFSKLVSQAVLAETLSALGATSGRIPDLDNFGLRFVPPSLPQALMLRDRAQKCRQTLQRIHHCGYDQHRTFVSRVASRPGADHDLPTL